MAGNNKANLCDCDVRTDGIFGCLETGNWNSQTQPSYHITLMIDFVHIDKLETSKRSSSLTGDKGCVGTEKEKSSFDSMNNIVANLLLNMTSSARFEGRYHNNFSISGDQSLENYIRLVCSS